jgi:hypothetical protein
MGKLGSFVVGVAVGAAGVFTGLKYHVVRAVDGFHLVPKLQAQFDEAYVDIRAFTATDWNEHRGLAVALTQSDKAYLLQESANETFRQSVDGVLKGLLPSKEPEKPQGSNPWENLPSWKPGT